MAAHCCFRMRCGAAKVSLLLEVEVRSVFTLAPSVCRRRAVATDDAATHGTLDLGVSEGSCRYTVPAAHCRGYGNGTLVHIRNNTIIASQFAQSMVLYSGRGARRAADRFEEEGTLSMHRRTGGAGAMIWATAVPAVYGGMCLGKERCWMSPNG